MSKATVIEVIGAGQYAVRLEYDTSNLDAAVAALQQQLVDLTQPILDAEVALLDLQDERDTLADALDAAIDAYTLEIQADPAGANITPVIAATKALAAKGAEVDIQRLRVQRLKNKRLTLAARKTLLENNSGAQQPESGLLMWCADHTPAIETGVVVPVTVVPGELSGSELTISPQQNPDGWGGFWSRDEFGQLVPRLSMTPEATFYNWAMLPGWQRWVPTFRHGVITSLNTANNTCSLDIEPASSSVEIYPYTNGLPVNLSESTITQLVGVPIRYMTCDAAAFEVGDRVLIRFTGVSVETLQTNWSNPEVIGFVTQPRECPLGPDPDPGDPADWVDWVQLRVLDKSDNGSSYYKMRRNDADDGWVIVDNDMPLQYGTPWRSPDGVYLYTYASPTGTGSPPYSYFRNAALFTIDHQASVVARQDVVSNQDVIIGHQWTSPPLGGTIIIRATRRGFGILPINGEDSYTYAGTIFPVGNVNPRIIASASADGTKFCLDSSHFSHRIMITVEEGAEVATLEEIEKSTAMSCDDNSSCEGGSTYTYSPDIETSTAQELYYYPPGSNIIDVATFDRSWVMSGTVTESSGATTTVETRVYNDGYGNSYGGGYTIVANNQVEGTATTTVDAPRLLSITLSPSKRFAWLAVGDSNGDITSTFTLDGVVIYDGWVDQGFTFSDGSGPTRWGGSLSCSTVESCSVNAISMTHFESGGGFQVLDSGAWALIHVINTRSLTPESPGRRFQVAVTSDGPLDLDSFLPGGWEIGRHEVSAFAIFRGKK